MYFEVRKESFYNVMQPQIGLEGNKSEETRNEHIGCKVSTSHLSGLPEFQKSTYLLAKKDEKIDPRELRRRLDSESARDCRLYQAFNSLALSDSESDSDVDKKTNITGIAHWGIKCNACLDAVVGIRWCCCTCINYNLCDICYKNGKHDHGFYRINEPGGKRVRAISRGSVDTFHICLDDLELSDSSEEYLSADSDSENTETDYSAKVTNYTNTDMPREEKF